MRGNSSKLTATRLQAALEAGRTRLRPVLMTALAMIIGMVPMSLGLGEGGEQNAPLGRAVIGGLLVSTMATLIFVPVVFALIHGRRRKAAAAGGDRPSAATDGGGHHSVRTPEPALA